MLQNEKLAWPNCQLVNINDFMRVQTFILRPLVVHNKLTNSKITNLTIHNHREYKIKTSHFFSTNILNKIQWN